MVLTEGEKFYRVAEIAELLSVAPRTVYKLLETGVLTHYKIGRSTIIRKRDLEHYLEKQRQ